MQLAPGSGSGRPPPTTTTATTRSPRQGPSSYERSEQAAEAFARAALRGRRSERRGGFWYATVRPGQVVDPIGDGYPPDHSFEPDPDWSRTILEEDRRAREERRYRGRSWRRSATCGVF